MLMSENEMAVLMIVLASLGGAWGAKRSGQQAWKGMLIVLASLILGSILLLSIGSESLIIGYIAAIIIAGVLGGALKLTGRQISMVIMGAVVILIPVAVISDLLV